MGGEAFRMIYDCIWDWAAYTNKHWRAFSQHSFCTITSVLSLLGESYGLSFFSRLASRAIGDAKYLSSDIVSMVIGYIGVRPSE